MLFMKEHSGRNGFMIKLDNIRKTYPGSAHAAIRGLNLVINSGELCTFVGPSGCGKTTILRMINQLDIPDAGDVYVQGVKLAAADIIQVRRQIGFVMQSAALFPHRTVAQNIATVPRLLGWSKKHIQARIDELVDLMSLDRNVLPRYPHQLSGGQQQRGAIARAIAVRPRVLLLDEPLSELDAQIRHNMVEEIARLHRELPELTILYVTHDQTEALTLADKIGIMKDGSLIAHGETHQLYHYPPNRFSAEFLGRANILQATALTDTAGPGLVSVSCGGGLIAAFSRGGQHGNNKLLCIRPQHMSLAPRSATSNRLNAILTSVHWQGDLTHLLCDVAGEVVRIVMTHVNPLPSAGDRLALYFEPNDAVLIEV